MHHFFTFSCARTLLAISAVSAALATLPAAAQQQHTHVHGKLSLNVAVDAKSLTVVLQSPLDNFLGFERAPRTDEERERVNELLKHFKVADKLLQPDPAAGCRQGRLTINDTMQKLVAATLVADTKHDDHKHDHKHDDHEHADIEAEIVFTCTNAALAKFIDAQQLFTLYPRIQSVDAQVASAQGQSKHSLRPGAARLDLGR